MKKADWTSSKDSGAISIMACLGWGLVFEESILEERTLGYVGVLLWKIPVSSHSLCKKRKCINVNLIIPNMAPGQLPLPANQITRQWRKEKTVFEKTSSGCERGGAGDSTDAAMQSLEGGALQEHVGEETGKSIFAGLQSTAVVIPSAERSRCNKRRNFIAFWGKMCVKAGHLSQVRLVFH